MGTDKDKDTCKGASENNDKSNVLAKDSVYIPPIAMKLR